jgi:hypothetical protein
MKRYLLLGVAIIVLSIYAASAWADRLVSDPSPAHVGASFEIWQAAKNLTDTQVVATGKVIVAKDMEADGSISYNLDSLVPATYYWYVRAYGYAYIYGTNNTAGGSKTYSVFVPFPFTKRAVQSDVIPGLKIAQ